MTGRTKKKKGSTTAKKTSSKVQRPNGLGGSMSARAKSRAQKGAIYQTPRKKSSKG